MSRMKRLAPLLVNADGEVSFVARFGHDLEQRIVVDLQAEAALPLVCQASLEVYDERVNRRSKLVVIKRDNEPAELPNDYEVVRTEKGRLAFVNLVEDELLLSLPNFPRKPGLGKVEYSTGGPTAENKEPERAGAQDGGKIKPFAALQEMLERKKQD